MDVNACTFTTKDIWRSLVAHLSVSTAAKFLLRGATTNVDLSTKARMVNVGSTVGLTVVLSVDFFWKTWECL